MNARAADAAAVQASAARLRAAGRAPRLALLLGTGWGSFVAQVQQAEAVPYAELPAFAVPGVRGHAGRAVLGRVGPHEVIVLAGRVHAYETDEPVGMNGAIRTLAALGVQALVQTNAAGSLDAALPPGTPMLLADHLNLPQRSPLAGATGTADATAAAAESRFVSMVDAYCPRLRAQARAAAARAGTPLTEGVYAWVLGPQFETPAEIRMLRLLGAQAVGMSTVPETIVARQAGLRVLALSLITNLAAGLGDEPISHARTLAVAQEASTRCVPLLEAVVAALEV
ncbi:MAG: purine nucleoside phosphorylase [Pseudomonadota bacterium]|nr:purine-nucleoside phosphorylase [Rubrivivax sp.]